MRTVLLLVATFVAGVLMGSRWGVHQLVNEALRTLRPGAFSKCADVHAGYPLSPIYQVEELQPGKHPIPGLVHVTIHGFRQHGMRNMEVWMQTLAPGGATPIHSHNCNEVILVQRGALAATMRGKDGALVTAPLRANSTFMVLPNARHQLRNEGQEDAHLIVVIDNPPFKVVAYGGWDDVGAGQVLSPIFWDAQCPDNVPPSMKHLVVGGPSAAGKQEL